MRHMVTKLDKVVILRSSNQWMVMSSSDNEKTLYLNFYEAYGYQTWQVGGL